MKIFQLLEENVIDFESRKQQMLKKQDNNQQIGLPIVPDKSKFKARLRSVPSITKEQITRAKSNRSIDQDMFNTSPAMSALDIEYITGLSKWTNELDMNWDYEVLPPNKYGIMKAISHYIDNSDVYQTVRSDEWCGEFDILKNKGWLVVVNTDLEGN